MNRFLLRFSLLFALAVGAYGSLASSLGGEAGASTKTSSRLLDQGIREFELQNYAEAIRRLQEAVVANPANSEAFSYLGRVYETIGNRTRAVKYYDIALDINPDELKALSWGGGVDVFNDDVEAAGIKLARLERLCAASCEEYRDLKAALDGRGDTN